MSRANGTACRLLTDSAICPDAVGALLMATTSFSRRTPEERGAIDAALTRLLKYANAESMLTLMRDERDALHYRFAAIVEHVESCRRCGDVPASSRTQTPSETDALLGIAILKSYELLTVSTNLYSQLYRVRRVAALDANRLPVEWQAFVAAARRTVPIIQQIIRSGKSGKELLRGSDIDLENKRELLRVTDVNNDKSAEELVRVVD